MKYMLMMNTPGGGPYQIANWPQQDLKAHIAFMMNFAKKLAESGELVAAEGLAGPDQAKLVRAGKDGKPITDGVFPESKEFLAGLLDRRRREPRARLRDRRAGLRCSWSRRRAAQHGDRGAASDERAAQRHALMPPSLDTHTQHLLRELAPQVLGAVVRRFRDFAASEDAVQEALIAAATQWPREGLPENPRAWLIQVASRRITDHVRAETARRHREALVVSLVPPEEQLALAADEEGATERDDTLDLLFMCCHPVLSPSSAIALTLRAVGGLTTFEIAKAFLVPEATMAQRISRAKQSIKDSGVPFQRPTRRGARRTPRAP